MVLEEPSFLPGICQPLNLHLVFVISIVSTGLILLVLTFVIEVIDMSQTFNDKAFSSLTVKDTYEPQDLNSVMRVLGQRSDTARKDSLNHNCVLEGLPFTWSYYTGYYNEHEDNSVEHRVITFPMRKISTQWRFYLDISEDGEVCISEGKNTNRTSLRLADLNAFSHRTQHQIWDYLESLINGRDMFFTAKQYIGVGTGWHRLERDLNADAEDEWKMYTHETIQQLSHDSEVYYHKDFDNLLVFNKDKSLDGEFDKVVFVISHLQYDEEDGWYRYINVVTNNSCMGPDYFDEPGSIMYHYDKESHSYTIDSESKEYWEWLPCFSKMEQVMKELGAREANDKEGEQEDWSYPVRYFGFVDGSNSAHLVTYWSAIPEGIRPHIFVAAESPWRNDKNDFCFYFDDIEDIELYKGANDPKKKEGKADMEDMLGDLVTFCNNHEREFPMPED